MSNLTNLIGLSFVSKIRPGNGITLLAFIYLGYICSSSTIGIIIYLIACVFLIWFIFILPHRLNARQVSWADDPGYKSRVKARHEREQAQIKTDKDNPYA